MGLGDVNKKSACVCMYVLSRSTVVLMLSRSTVVLMLSMSTAVLIV